MYFNVLFETIENNLSLFSYLFFLTNLIESTRKKVDKQNTPLKKYAIQFIKKQVLMYQLIPRINCIDG